MRPGRRLRTAVGVDGCRAGWIAAARTKGSARVTWQLAGEFREILSAWPAPTLIAVDMPIGLPDGARVQPRPCDLEARRLLGERRSSVFAPPLRRHLKAPGYHAGPRQDGLSIQAWNLVPRIRDLDDALGSSPPDRCFEAHPELAFLALAGTPMRHPKKTPEGREERLGALCGRRRRGPLNTALEEAMGRWRRREVAPDDLIDALALAELALRALEAPPRRLGDEGDRDARGRPMTIAW